MTATQTLTAIFDDRAEATSAVDELVAAGVPRTAIRITPETDVSRSDTTATGYDTSADEHGFWASLKGLFMPDEDRHTYTEAMHRGGIMVSVSAEAAHADLAADILEKHGTVDMDEREASWRQEGWAGHSATGAGTAPIDAMSSGATMGGASAGATAASVTSGARNGAAADEEAVQEVEEQLRVGKRQVDSGRVRVRSYVVETPVSEDVNLHSETVRVERRPVDRAVDATEDAFRERTIEAVATSEEAVVSKEARVTGEVLIRKEASDETRTVTDKVRSTKVEVEDDTHADTLLEGTTPTTRR